MDNRIDRINNDMFGKKDTSLGKVIVIILLAITLVIIALAMRTLSVSALGDYPYNWVVQNDAVTPICDLDIHPNQDSTYPPEGYHCRPSNDDTPRKVREESDSPSSDTNTPPNEVIIPEPNDNDDTPPNEEIIPDEPTDPIVTPEPEEPPQDETPPTEDTPKEKCNAGRGNGSEGNPDCDPGNSGGHNNGGD